MRSSFAIEMMSEFISEKSKVVETERPVHMCSPINRTYEITVLYYPKGNTNIHVLRKKIDSATPYLAITDFRQAHYDECFDPCKYDVQDIHVKDITI